MYLVSFIGGAGCSVQRARALCITFAALPFASFPRCARLLVLADSVRTPRVGGVLRCIELWIWHRH